MKFQVVISTMNNKFHNRKIEVDFPYLIINQITEALEPIKDICTINTQSKGLSLSRNLALSSSKADICLISDDDLEYLPNIEENILNIFKLYPDADIITFKIITTEGNDYKKYSTKPFYHNILTLMRVSSVEIAIRTSSIENNLMFDEDFGLGSKFPTGEEAIFLTDAYKRGKKILYYPLEIVVHPPESSGSNYHVSNLAKTKGAVFYRVFRWKSYIICPIFAKRHYKKSPYSYFVFLKELYKGIREYKSTIY